MKKIFTYCNTMSITFISLGFNCHPKMYLNTNNLSIDKSLPFDYNLTYKTQCISSILEKLQKEKIKTKFTKICYIQEKIEVAVNDENDIHYVHFFHTSDLIKNINQFPSDINGIKSEKLLEVSEKFDRRFNRLYEYLNNFNGTLCLIRIVPKYIKEDYNEELKRLTSILKKFKTKLYLIYLNEDIKDIDCYNNSKKINTDYDIPCLLYNYELEDNYYSTQQNNFANMINDFINYITVKTSS